VTNAATFEHGSLHDKQGNKKKFPFYRIRNPACKLGAWLRTEHQYCQELKKKKKRNPRLKKVKMNCSVVPKLRRQRQEDHEFKASLGYSGHLDYTQSQNW
jgi:hypothetical protein